MATCADHRPCVGYPSFERLLVHTTTLADDSGEPRSITFAVSERWKLVLHPDQTVWAREERDALRDAARLIGAPVELRYVSADADELWRRIVDRDLEGRWGSRSIRRDELDEWVGIYQPPTDDELATYDAQERTLT